MGSYSLLIIVIIAILLVSQRDNIINKTEENMFLVHKEDNPEIYGELKEFIIEGAGTYYGQLLNYVFLNKTYVWIRAPPEFKGYNVKELYPELIDELNEEKALRMHYELDPHKENTIKIRLLKR